MEQIDKMLSTFDFSYPAHIRIDQVKDTLDYKAVFWIWMKALATSFTERDKSGTAYKDQDMHDLMCHKYLGYTRPKTLGKTKIEPALRTITYPQQLTRGEFFDLLRNIEIWASDVGVVLPQKPNSEYEQDKQKAEAA